MKTLVALTVYVGMGFAFASLLVWKDHWIAGMCIAVLLMFGVKIRSSK